MDAEYLLYENADRRAETYEYAYTYEHEYECLHLVALLLT